MSARPIKVAPWEDFVLRLIAVYKLAKAALSVAIGIGLIRAMNQNVAELFRIYIIDPLHFDPENRLLKWILDQASELTPHKMELFSFGAFFYAAVFATEGIGLFLRKHWAEYMVLISTGSLLPIEFYEIYLQMAWWKAAVVVGNLAILIYLIHRLLLDSRTAREEGPTGSGRSSKMLDHPESGSSTDDSNRVVSEVP